MRDALLGALAIVMLGTSLGLLQEQLVGPRLELMQPYRAPVDQRVGLVDVSTAFALFQSGKGVFVDAREPERYAEGHVPGAVNLQPDGELAMLPYGGTLVIYCDGAECGASARLADHLAQQRTGKIVIMPAGWPGWQAAGYPVMDGSRE